MIVTLALCPCAATALAPTLLYLWQAQNPGEEGSPNWWLWLLLILLFVVLVWWLLSRESPSAVTEENRREHQAPVHAPTPVHHAVAPEPVAAVALPAHSVASGVPDNLTKIEGIGPKINEILHNAGIHTFAELAQSDVGHLRTILLQAGLRVNDPTTWPEQAALAATGQWEDLQALQNQLGAGGRRRA